MAAIFDDPRTSHSGQPQLFDPITMLYQHAAAPFTMRSRVEIEALLGGFELVLLGVVFMPLWHPDSPADVDSHPERFNGYAVVGQRD